MPGSMIQGSRDCAIRWLLVFASLGNTLAAYSQANNSAAATSPQNETSFQLKVSSNLVVVRAVVRDAQGSPSRISIRKISSSSTAARSNPSRGLR